MAAWQHRRRGFMFGSENAGCSSTKQSRHFYGLNNCEANKGTAKGRRAEQGKKELPFTIRVKTTIDNNPIIIG